MPAAEETKTKEAINQLKERFKGDMRNDLYEDDKLFYRFLKARDFDLDNAEKMLRNHLEFRKKYDFDNISKYNQPEVLKKYLPLEKIGHDKDGSVVRYCACGNVDWIGLSLSAKPEDFAKRLILESAEDDRNLEILSEKLGKTVDYCVYIFNLDKISFTMATNKKALLTVIFLGDLFQNNYPEKLKAVYVINASSYFHLVFAVLKCFLAPNIIDKVKIYSDDSYKEDLLNVIDADILPAFLGGNKTDPDGNPLCTSFIDHGQIVPQTYYISKNRKLLKDLPDTKKLVLKNASFEEVFVDVKIPGSYLEWEFETKCRDIGFGVFYKDIIDGKEKVTELISIQRIDTEECSKTGMYLCEKSGTYVIVFDNTYSWVRAKEIYYRIKILTPKEREQDLMD